MRAILLGCAAVLFAGSAAAQTTVCGEEFGKWVCRTQQPAQTPNIYASGQAAYDRALQQGQQQRQDREAAQARATRNQVAAYVRSGQCEAAKDLALQAGDMALADQAARLCVQR